MTLTFRPCRVCGRHTLAPSGECRLCREWAARVQAAVIRQDAQFRESCCDGGGYEKLPTHLR